MHTCTYRGREKANVCSLVSSLFFSLLSFQCFCIFPQFKEMSYWLNSLPTINQTSKTLSNVSFSFILFFFAFFSPFFFPFLFILRFILFLFSYLYFSLLCNCLKPSLGRKLLSSERAAWFLSLWGTEFEISIQKHSSDWEVSAPQLKFSWWLHWPLKINSFPIPAAVFQMAVKKLFANRE